MIYLCVFLNKYLNIKIRVGIWFSFNHNKRTIFNEILWMTSKKGTIEGGVDKYFMRYDTKSAAIELSS
jgi:hypothetical protein